MAGELHQYCARGKVAWAFYGRLQRTTSPAFRKAELAGAASLHTWKKALFWRAIDCSRVIPAATSSRRARPVPSRHRCSDPKVLETLRAHMKEDQMLRKRKNRKGWQTGIQHPALADVVVVHFHERGVLAWRGGCSPRLQLGSAAGSLWPARALGPGTPRRWGWCARPAHMQRVHASSKACAPR